MSYYSARGRPKGIISPSEEYPKSESRVCDCAGFFGARYFTNRLFSDASCLVQYCTYRSFQRVEVMLAM